MMNINRPRASLTLLSLAALWGSGAVAQTINVTEDFTGTSTTNSWYALRGACLTAGTTVGTASSTVAGVPPGCTADSYYTETLVGGYNGVSGSGTTLPDPVGNGALRFTNGCIGSSSTNCPTGGLGQNGAIVSGNSYSSSNGIQITFKTTTYRGNSYNGPGGDSDGADGMSFFLINGSVTPTIGSYGGSLGYSCSDNNPDYHGMIGGYIGLGIDEYGNFLNAGDNTASGYGYVPNRIGMRGAGSIAYPWLASTYASYYGSGTVYPGSSSDQNNAVRYTCKNGYLSDYNGNSVNGTWSLNTLNQWVNSGDTTLLSVYDYLALPGANTVLSGVTIADEYANGGYSRQVATTIMYKLKITPTGLLSLSYSLSGGAWQGVLANQSIMASNGPLPGTIRFGFAGSTGGGSNIHEVLCFKAASLDAASSSSSSNLENSSKLTSSAQAYFAYYNPNDWTGRLTANALTSDTAGDLFISSTATWDTACVLTGIPSGSSCTTTGVAGPTAAEGPTSRVMLTWNGAAGAPFEWANLTPAQQLALNQGDSNGTTRLSYLRGDRTNEVTTAGTGLYRDRDFVLSDIMDSSPIAVGQPVSPYAITWKDKLDTGDVMLENSGTQNYYQFFTAEQTRQNMVYVGANDGMLHGLRAGSYDTSNNFLSATNDGYELLAYVPGSVLQSAASSTTSTNCVSTTATQTVVQNIHGYTPLIGGSAACTQATLDFSNTQYGHNFFVDATPASGDLFYQGAWHTWLVGGLGAGGAAIFALDVTAPGTFSEANASAIVKGEWTPSLTCTNVTGCGASLGNTFGTPLIRRMHNGDWAVIFGNGFGSSSGDAGVYIMAIDQGTGAQTFYYLSTGSSGMSDGIAYVTTADLDGDHVIDYIYAGDLLGNVWRFDVTSATPSSWSVGSAPLFSAGAGHPITSSVVVAAVVGVPGTQVIVAFGTGQQTGVTNLGPTTYATGTQSLYAVWDWNLTAWNAQSTTNYAALATTTANFTALTGMTAPYTVTPSLLTAQTLTVNTTLSTVDIASSTICWAGTLTCAANQSFGWSATLPNSGEQIVYNPELVGSALVVNSLIPAPNSVLLCTTSNNTGYTYAINLVTGTASTTNTTVTTTVTTNAATSTTTTTITTATNGISTTTSNTTTGTVSTTGTTTTTRNVAQNFFLSNNDSNAAAALTNAVGSSFVVTTTIGAAGGIGAGAVPINGAPANCTVNCAPAAYPNPFANVSGCSPGANYLISQTSSGTPLAQKVVISCPLTGQRISWSQKR